MMLLPVVKLLLGIEAVWGLALVLLLIFVIRNRFMDSSNDREEIRAATMEALTAFLGGNRDLKRLRNLASGHPQLVRETVLQCQTSVGERTDDFCELAVVLGYVDRWCHDAHSSDITIRRDALARLAEVAHYAPARRAIGAVPERAFTDPDEEARLQGARILLAAGEPADVDRVFQSVLADTPRIRTCLALDLGSHAARLCRTVIPSALASADAKFLISLLRLVASWERGLPLSIDRAAAHPDAAVRVEAMRLLPLLPVNEANLGALHFGLSDEDPLVRQAAAAAGGRLSLTGPTILTGPTSDNADPLSTEGALAGC